MNWSFLMWFGIGLAVYIVAILLFGIIKHAVNKKRFKKEIEENGEIINQSENSENKN